jgi:hypothetical protein
MEKVYKTKLVENVDGEVWRGFTGYCKSNKLLAGHKLSEIRSSTQQNYSFNNIGKNFLGSGEMINGIMKKTSFF